MDQVNNVNEKFLNLTELSKETGLGISIIKKLRKEVGAPFTKTGRGKTAQVVTKKSEFETWFRAPGRAC